MPYPTVGSSTPVGAGGGLRNGDNLETVNRATFANRVLKASGPVIVEFMSYGCSHCRDAEPHVQEVARQLKGKYQFFRVNVPVEGQLATEYGIRGTPTFVMFQNGRELGRAEGPQPTVPTIMAAVTRPFRT